MTILRYEEKSKFSRFKKEFSLLIREILEKLIQFVCFELIEKIRAI